MPRPRVRVLANRRLCRAARAQGPSRPYVDDAVLTLNAKDRTRYLPHAIAAGSSFAERFRTELDNSRAPARGLALIDGFNPPKQAIGCDFVEAGGSYK